MPMIRHRRIASLVGGLFLALAVASTSQAGSLLFTDNNAGDYEYGRMMRIPSGFGAGEFTLEMWIQPDSSYPVGSTADGAGQRWNWSSADYQPYRSPTWWYEGNFLLDGHNNVSVTQFEQGTFSLQMYGGGRVRWLFGDGYNAGPGRHWSVGAYPAATAPSLLDGNWHHLAVVRRWAATGGADLELWVDGTLTATQHTPLRTNMRQWWDDWSGFPARQEGWYLGAEKQAALGILNQYEDYKGLVSQMAFWSRAKPADEIASGFGAAIPDGSSGLVGMFRFSEDVGTVTRSAINGQDQLTLIGPNAQQMWSELEAPVGGGGGGPGGSPVAASFDADPTSGEKPLTVTFQDTSSGSPDSWWWDFGDGVTSSDQNPVHVYQEVGDFTVSLTVSRDGASERVEWPGAVTVAPPDVTPPVAEITATNLEGEVPLAVSLEANSAHEVWEWAWDFGDGSSGTGRTLAHTYDTPGTYTVTLTVTGPGGQSVTELADNVIASSPLVAADFSVSVASGDAPLSVRFTDESTGPIDSWGWDFGDGGYSSARSPGYVYEQPGEYSVSLTVGGPYGSNTTTQNALVTVSSAVPSGLVAAFGFEEAGGQQALDSSPEGNHGNLSGANRSNSGRYGRALDFDGNFDVVTVPWSPSLNFDSGFTFEAWVFPRTNLREWRTVVNREGAASNDIYLASSTPDRRPAAGGLSGGGGETTATGTSSLPTYTWSHLASTNDGDRIRLYVDGIEVASSALNGVLSAYPGPVSIGGNSIWGEYFSGLIDEVRIYNRALSASEVQQDMSAPVEPD
jgi:PKD repeat protein